MTRVGEELMELTWQTLGRLRALPGSGESGESRGQGGGGEGGRW